MVFEAVTIPASGDAAAGGRDGPERRAARRPPSGKGKTSRGQKTGCRDHAGGPGLAARLPWQEYWGMYLQKRAA